MPLGKTFWVSCDIQIKLWAFSARFPGRAGDLHADKPHGDGRDHGDDDAHGRGHDDGGGDHDGRDDDGPAFLNGTCLCKTCRKACSLQHSNPVRLHPAPRHGDGGFLELRQLHPRNPALGYDICTKHKSPAAPHQKPDARDLWLKFYAYVHLPAQAPAYDNHTPRSSAGGHR